MRRLMLMTIVATLSLCLASCRKDFYSLIGLDTDAPIELRLYGSNYEWRGEKFGSNAGYFTDSNHPDIVIKDDVGFTLDLRRSVTSQNGNTADLYLYINNDLSPLELNRVYSLVLLGDGMACIDFSERGATQTLPSGGTVTEIITHCYKATQGYITITAMEKYNGDYLISGEFEFKGVCQRDGDVLEVRDGKFSDCRICVSEGRDCHGVEVK